MAVKDVPFGVVERVFYELRSPLQAKRENTESFLGTVCYT